MLSYSYYTDVQRYGAPNAFKFSPGLKQKLPKGVCRLDLGKYRLPDLTHYRDDYYPLVIAIESLFPESYKGRAKKSMQFSCGAFAVEADNTFKFKLIKQKLLVSDPPSYFAYAYALLVYGVVQQDYFRPGRHVWQRKYSSDDGRRTARVRNLLHCGQGHSCSTLQASLLVPGLQSDCAHAE